MKKKGVLGNQGFSLIELVIVMAIILIIGLAAFSGVKLLASRPVDECAKKMQIALEGNRNTTMGKLSSEIAFSADATGIWAEETINGKSEGKVQIGQSGVVVKYELWNSDTNTKTVSTLGGTPLEMSFDRASGSVMPQGGGKTYVTAFIVSRGDRELTVTVDRLTGRIGVE